MFSFLSTCTAVHGVVATIRRVAEGRDGSLQSRLGPSAALEIGIVLCTVALCSLLRPHENRMGCGVQGSRMININKQRFDDPLSILDNLVAFASPHPYYCTCTTTVFILNRLESCVYHTTYRYTAVPGADYVRSNCYSSTSKYMV